jgi:hypothetical protein
MFRNVASLVMLMAAVGMTSCRRAERPGGQADKKSAEQPAAETIFIDPDKHVLALEKILGMARADVRRQLGQPDLSNKLGEKGKDDYLKAAVTIDYDEADKATKVLGYCNSPTVSCRSKVFGIGLGDLKKECVAAWGEPAAHQDPLFADGPFADESVLWRHKGYFIWLGIAVRDSDGRFHKALGNYKTGTVLHISVAKGE